MAGALRPIERLRLARALMPGARDLAVLLEWRWQLRREIAQRRRAAWLRRLALEAQIQAERDLLARWCALGAGAFLACFALELGRWLAGVLA